MNPFTQLIAFFIEPQRAYTELKKKPNFWFPLLAITLTTAAIMAWYYAIVDLPWLIDRMAGSEGNDPKVKEEMAKHMTRGVMLGSSVGAILIILPVIYLLYSLYYLLAGKILNTGVGFKAWFSFTCWSSVPALLSVLLMIVQILGAENGQVAQEQLDITSMNSLFTQLQPGHKWAGFYSQINLSMIWSIVLSIIGWRIWSGRGWTIASIVVMLPYVLIYGGWALFITLR